MNAADYIAVEAGGKMSFRVNRQHSAARIGSGPQLSQDGRLEVLSTPSLIAFMEILAYQMLEERLPDEFTSVGVQVEISHQAPSPVGSVIRIHSQVSQIEGRKVTFLLQAWDEREKVGEGTHTRVVVDRQRFIHTVLGKLGS